MPGLPCFYLNSVDKNSRNFEDVGRLLLLVIMVPTYVVFFFCNSSVVGIALYSVSPVIFLPVFSNLQIFPLPNHRYLASASAGCFSRRWPILRSRKLVPKKLYYFTVPIRIITWAAAKLGIFTHFTSTNLPRLAIASTQYHMYTIRRPTTAFLWVLDQSRDCTSSYYRRPKKIVVLPHAWFSSRSVYWWRYV